MSSVSIQTTELRSCVKVEVAVLGSPSLISLMVSVDVNHHERRSILRAQELCESRGGRPRLPVPNKPYGFCGRKSPRKKKKVYTESSGAVLKVEVVVLGSPSLISLMVSVDAEQHLENSNDFGLICTSVSNVDGYERNA